MFFIDNQEFLLKLQLELEKADFVPDKNFMSVKNFPFIKMSGSTLFLVNAIFMANEKSSPSDIETMIRNKLEADKCRLVIVYNIFVGESTDEVKKHITDSEQYLGQEIYFVNYAVSGFNKLIYSESQSHAPLNLNIIVPEILQSEKKDDNMVKEILGARFQKYLLPRFKHRFSSLVIAALIFVLGFLLIGIDSKNLIPHLSSLGAASTESLKSGEWYRLFIAGLINDSLFSSIFYALIFFLYAGICERYLGSIRFFSILFASSAVAVLTDSLVNPSVIYGTPFLITGIMGALIGIITATNKRIMHVSLYSVVGITIIMLIPSSNDSLMGLVTGLSSLATGYVFSFIFSKMLYHENKQ